MHYDLKIFFWNGPPTPGCPDGQESLSGLGFGPDWLGFEEQQ